jgi:hypothetical protein
MSNASPQLHLIDQSTLTLPEAIRRAIGELENVRSGMEQAFDVIHMHADSDAVLKPDYIIAMQSIDAMSQQIAAIERFILNVTRPIGDDALISTIAAAEGITLAAVAARLTGNNRAEHDSSDCDFF